jgi:hypothetical protein
MTYELTGSALTAFFILLAIGYCGAFYVVFKK